MLCVHERSSVYYKKPLILTFRIKKYILQKKNQNWVLSSLFGSAVLRLQSVSEYKFQSFNITEGWWCIRRIFLS